MWKLPFPPARQPASGAERLPRSSLQLPLDPLRRRASIAWGRMVLLFRPQLTEQFEAGRRPTDQHERSALHALTASYRGNDRLDRLAAQHVEFWSGPSALPFHANAAHRFERVFRKRHYAIVAQLEKVIAASGVVKLCEIGCGSGQVLTHLARCLPTLTRLVGLDLSAEQIAINRARNRDSRVEYQHGDAATWIASHADGGWAWFCYGGVLEFFTQQSLVDLLELCAARPPVVFALVEPLADDFDVDREATSLRFNIELTLSHAYPRLLAAAGFQTVWRSECRAMGFRWLMLIAQRQDP